MSDEEIVKICKEKKKNFKLSPDEIVYVEERSRNQSLSHTWYELRVGRITGSVIYEVSKSSVKKPSRTLITRICQVNNARINTPAIKWGKDHEKDALSLYENVFSDKKFTSK